MSLLSPMRAFRSVDFLGATILLLLLAGVAWLPAQEAQPPSQKSADAPAKSAPRDERIDAIEKSLQSLLKEVQSLRQPGSTPQAAAPSAPSPLATATAKPSPSFEVDPQWLKSLSWRSIGPANMGGRITDIAMNASDPSMWWIATASGGLLKTINNGITL